MPKSKCCNQTAVPSKERYFCGGVEGCGKWCDVVEETIEMKQDIRVLIKQLITEEINICHQEGTPTSRLTSLYNKIDKLT